MILCIAKKGLYLNGSYITEKMFEEKIQLFFENVLDNIKIFNVMFFYQDVQPKDYAPLLTTIKEKYQIFLDNKTQEQFGKPYDELKSHEKYSIPYRISFNEIERKFMTESQSTSGLKCH